MKVQLEATSEQLSELIALIDSESNLIHLKEQLLNALELEHHVQDDDVPKTGDNPIIDRFE
jgi:hypothetical protein